MAVAEHPAGNGIAVMDGLYSRLTEEMPTHQKQNLDYITGEQAISRLNDTLGVDGWDFAVKRIWLDREADCVMCIGALVVRWPNGTTSTHEDIGSQMPNRKKDGSFVELGSDFKGARTDCLKRCAADIGVGLWLYHKLAGSTFARPAAAPRPEPTPIQPPRQPKSAENLSPSRLKLRTRITDLLIQASKRVTKEQRDAMKIAALASNLPEDPRNQMSDEHSLAWAELIQKYVDAAPPF